MGRGLFQTWLTRSSADKSFKRGSGVSAVKLARWSMRLKLRRGGAEVLHLIARMRTDIARLMAEVVEHHIGTLLVDAETHPDALDADGVEDLLEVVHAFLK